MASGDARLNPDLNRRGSLFGPGLERSTVQGLPTWVSPAELVSVLLVSENAQRRRVSSWMLRGLGNAKEYTSRGLASSRARCGLADSQAGPPAHGPMLPSLVPGAALVW